MYTNFITAAKISVTAIDLFIVAVGHEHEELALRVDTHAATFVAMNVLGRHVGADLLAQYFGGDYDDRC